jgi:hypothetical protein
VATPSSKPLPLRLLGLALLVLQRLSIWLWLVEAGVEGQEMGQEEVGQVALERGLV